MKVPRVDGERIILTQYSPTHVPKYHSWFLRNDDLHELTSTPEFTLQPAHEWQHEWEVKDDRIAFVVLERKSFEDSGIEVESMLGDATALFTEDRTECEVSLMIAEKQFRGKGYGSELLQLLVLYLKDNFKELRKIHSRIEGGNDSSRYIFEKAGFEMKFINMVFNQYNMELIVC